MAYGKFGGRRREVRVAAVGLDAEDAGVLADGRVVGARRERVPGRRDAVADDAAGLRGATAAATAPGLTAQRPKSVAGPSGSVSRAVALVVDDAGQLARRDDEVRLGGAVRDARRGLDDRQRDDRRSSGSAARSRARRPTRSAGSRPGAAAGLPTWPKPSQWKPVVSRLTLKSTGATEPGAELGDGREQAEREDGLVVRVDRAVVGVPAVAGRVGGPLQRGHVAGGDGGRVLRDDRAVGERDVAEVRARCSTSTVTVVFALSAAVGRRDRRGAADRAVRRERRRRRRWCRA